ncbi:MAG TPA: ABC transporter permease [Candidatus Baltobacteraceae bacterium]|jgi:ABC-type transport system involved in multi-copper enzyme maturation permease subunit|nr:ABC transporter permease [Candidatus Baltobacteraceae bacterium]
MNKIITIAGLTWKAAFRYRLFWVMTVLLAAAVVGLPLMLKDDGTAKGLTQILLTYTLTAVSTLLGCATLWLSCGTLAKDVEECQMQVVSVKPIARWQIWLGKWLGILSLNAVLLALSAGAIFGLLQWRANRLPADQQAILHHDIFIARAEARRPPVDLSAQVDAALKERVKGYAALSDYQIAELRQQITGQIAAEYSEVPPGFRRRWGVDLHTLRDSLRDQPLELRVKFHAASPNPDAQYSMYWVIGPTNSAGQVTILEKLPPDSFQEFQIPPDLLDDRGILWVDVVNPPENSALSFPIEDGFELLYPESSFVVNFARGMAVIFCWLALLASIGLAAASYLSFPVAAFVSVALLIMGLSSGTIGSVVENGTITGYDPAKAGYGRSPVDIVLVPVFRGALKIIKLVEGFSPIDDLSSGRSITWGQLGLAVLQIVVLLGGFFCVLGMIFFTRRELATAQGNN